MYALKILQKDRLVATKQVQNVRVEKQVLELCDHPFITRLVCTIKDANNLYFLLEYLQGGELFNIMTSAPYGGKLTLTESRFYMGCVVSALALAYLYRVHLERKHPVWFGRYQMISTSALNMGVGIGGLLLFVLQAALGDRQHALVPDLGGPTGDGCLVNASMPQF